MIVITSFPCSITLNGSWDNTSSPSSILDISRTSLINDKRWFAAIFAFSRFLFKNVVSSSCFLSISKRPIIPFNGVRMSWDIRERKFDFAALARFAVLKASWSNFFWWISFATTSSTFKNPRTMIPDSSSLINRNW